MKSQELLAHRQMCFTESQSIRGWKGPARDEVQPSARAGSPRASQSHSINQVGKGL